MLEKTRVNNIAYARRTIRDITEPRPIPRGARVEIQDEIECDGVFIVEYDGRIYTATPDELRF